jgi:hypothetical protein
MRNKIAYCSVVCCLIIGSFFIYSTAYFPGVNSDMSINVLMAYLFKLPEDVYWWGQDRLGSFIPLISQLFIKGFGVSPLYAVSVANYLVLVGGFLGFTYLLKSNFSKLLLLIPLFFPYERYAYFNQFPIGLSYGLFGFSILFLSRITFQESPLKKINFKWVVLTGLVWLCGVWVSDLLFISLLTLGITAFGYVYLNKSFKSFHFQKYLIAFILTIISIASCIKVLKTFASHVNKNLASINNLAEVKYALSVMYFETSSILKFNDTFLVSLGAWVMLVLFVGCLIYYVKNFKQIISGGHFWMSFFLADFVGILLLIVLSHWVYLNNMGRWYFVAPYLSASLFVISVIDYSKVLQTIWKQVLVFVMVSVVGVSYATSLYHWHGHYTPTTSLISQLDTFGQVGIIGDYWHSYQWAIKDPDRIKATAHDKSNVKSVELVSQTLSQPRLLICRNEWLDQFPDSMQQFGLTLKRKGEPFSIKQEHFCEYQLLHAQKDTNTFDAFTLFTTNGIIDSVNRSYRFTQDRMITAHAVFGPKMILKPGHYQVAFYLSDYDMQAINEQIIADVSYDFGIKSISKLILNEQNFDVQNGCWMINFSTERTLLGAEFRLIEKKPLNYVFNKIVVVRRP